MQPIRQMKYEVRFLTPAFLGNAEQSGQWRTPPFKALLRQWWRVAYAADRKFVVDVSEMRRDEGLLFGNAWLTHEENGRTVNDTRKSLVRIRLNRWTGGTLRGWDGLEQGAVFHPEVERTNFRVGPHAYLGFGPLDGRGGTRLGKPNAAIQYGETAALAIAVPDAYAAGIRSAMALMNAYGALGGRSRNGWGSLECCAPGDPSHIKRNLTRFTRSWSNALSVDWPHAVGRDNDGPLVWQTARRYTDWKPLMRDLAIVKIGLRTMFVLPNQAPPHQAPLDRHWLSYPITRHGTRRWARNLRLPNSLRFKIRPDAKETGALRGVIFHVPCRPPAVFGPDAAAIKRVWKRVHEMLDELASTPASGRTYRMIADTGRRGKLKPQLDTVTLERIPQ